MVIVTASVTERGFYMDFKDGAEQWESFIVGPFLEHLRATYKVSSDPKKTFITGISMGGMGSLRIAFKHPELFGAVAGQEPGIEPILAWQEMKPKHRFWRDDGLFEKAYGKPVDPVYWAANNPASIVAANPQRLRDSGLQIYLEAGDEDPFWLYEGAEFLHQVLWDRRVKHEYHLVRGADHVGPSVGVRTREAYKFLARSMKPWSADDLPAPLKARMSLIMRPKDKLEEKDHYSHPEAAPTIMKGW
jgi:S-formylglutathione hydrolase